jgi:NTE family protein
MNEAIIKKLKSAKKLGIAFGGGGARGIAHVGVLKVLNEVNIKPEFISGTSFGAIVGGLYCNGYSWEEIFEIIQKTKWHQVIDFSLKGGIIKGKAFHKVLATHLPDTFADLKYPLSVIATNIHTGTEVIISKGNLPAAIRASSCFPGVFEPVEFEKMKLIDGGVVNNVPVSALHSYAVDRSIAINVNMAKYDTILTSRKRKNRKLFSKIRQKRKKPSPTDVIFKTLDLLQNQLCDINLAVSKPDLYIDINLKDINMFEFDKSEDIFKIGEARTRELLDL